MTATIAKDAAMLTAGRVLTLALGIKDKYECLSTDTRRENNDKQLP